MAHHKTQTPSPGHPALGHGSHVGAAHIAQPSLVVTGLQPAATHAGLSSGGQTQKPFSQFLVQHWLGFLHALPCACRCRLRPPARREPARRQRQHRRGCAGSGAVTGSGRRPDKAIKSCGIHRAALLGRGRRRADAPRHTAKTAQAGSARSAIAARAITNADKRRMGSCLRHSHHRPRCGNVNRRFRNTL